MPTELVDFDAARAERAVEPILVVKVSGRRIQLLRPMAGAVLDFLRAMREPAKQTSETILALYEGLFGEYLAELQAALSPGELNELAGRYCGAAMKEGAASPNRQTRRATKSRQSRSTSSNAGRSSRRTSSASTASTSASR